MATIDPDAALKIQPELLSGESLQWAGKPNPGVIFHSDDWYAIPFSLLWGGFTIFWEAGALGYWGKSVRGASTFAAIWGIPFILIGQYLIWGRFLYDAWLKRRTYYAVTNRRVLVLQEGWQRQTKSNYLEGIPAIEREGTTRGTIWFGAKYSPYSGRAPRSRSTSHFAIGYIPVFADIDDVDSVYRLVTDLREKARKEAAVFG